MLIWATKAEKIYICGEILVGLTEATMSLLYFQSKGTESQLKTGFCVLIQALACFYHWNFKAVRSSWIFIIIIIFKRNECKDQRGLREWCFLFLSLFPLFFLIHCWKWSLVIHPKFPTTGRWVSSCQTKAKFLFFSGLLSQVPNEAQPQCAIRSWQEIIKFWRRKVAISNIHDLDLMSNHCICPKFRYPFWWTGFCATPLPHALVCQFFKVIWLREQISFSRCDK
jgi:hypothetical protein